ncbi:MAG: hypothetical protein LHV69_08535 [Elusimicrobia bacterium]|nr:hypothetical protein [Candidatus Obscuribacterium magneticum]
MGQLHKRLSLQTVWQVVRQFQEKKLSIKVACDLLEVSKSRLYQLEAKWGNVPAAEMGKRSLYERETPLLLAPEVQEFLKKEIRFIKTESKVLQGHLNFAVLAQECHKRFDKRFHRNTLRRWAIREGLFNPAVDPTGKALNRFEMGGIGALFQHDSSIHLWVPFFKFNTVLILTEDDHSRKVVGARLVPNDTSWHHLCVARNTIETHGRPAAYYTDNHMIFSPSTDIHAQFNRALRSLDILLKLTGKAHPEAKGKLEKRNDYFQRRIPYLCERHNITNLTWGNKILDDEVAYYNERHIHAEIKETPQQRWDRALKEGRCYLRPLPDKAPLDVIFGLHYERVLSKCGTFQFCGRTWTVSKAPRYGKVTVVLRPPTSLRKPHTELIVLYKGGSQTFTIPRSQTLKPHHHKLPDSPPQP